MKGLKIIMPYKCEACGIRFTDKEQTTLPHTWFPLGWCICIPFPANWEVVTETVQLYQIETRFRCKQNCFRQTIAVPMSLGGIASLHIRSIVSGN